MKQISNEQMKAILDELFKLNVPTQTYAGIQELFNKLPAVEESKSEVKE